MTAPSLNSWDGLLVQPEYDQPETQPTVHYLLCSLPRSGSSFLCDRLYQAGLGIPSEYWFPHLPTQTLIRRWGCANISDYLRILPTRRTVNGVFGMKTHWQQYRKTQWEWGRPDIHFPDLRYIRLERKDLIRQTVSWYAAALFDYWNDVGYDPQPTMPIPYEQSALDKIHRAVEAQTECWDNFLSHHDHLVVVFEEFQADQAGTLQAIADFLDVEVFSQPGEPLINRMRLNGFEEVVERYRASR